MALHTFSPQSKRLTHVVPVIHTPYYFY